jgi:pre-rRNA-processing protein TSR4
VDFGTRKLLTACFTFRYHWNGTAVMMTDAADQQRPGRCEVCGAPRVFECQLMPTLVYILQAHLCRQASSLPAVEFGTAIVYSCSASCWDDQITDSKSYQFRKEVLRVQFES